MIDIINKYKFSFLIFIPITLSAIIQSTIINNFFIADDFIHIYQANNGNFWEFLITPNGGQFIPFLSLFFYFFLKLFGINTQFYFIFVLFIHLINVALLYYLIFSFTKKRFPALFFSTVWGTSPINQGSLGWFTSFSYVLIVTIVLLILIDFGSIINSRKKPHPVMLIKWMILLIICSLTCGVGMAITLSFFVISWFLLYGTEYRKKITLYLAVITLTVPATYIYLSHLYIKISGMPSVIQIIPYGTLHFWDLTVKMIINLFSYGIFTLLTGPLLIFFPKLSFPLSYIVFLSVFIFLTAIFIHSSKSIRNNMLAYLLLLLCITFFISFGRAFACDFYNWTTQDMVITAPRYFYILNIILLLLLCSAYDTFPFLEQLNKPLFNHTVAVLIIAFLFFPSLRGAELVNPNRGFEARKYYQTMITQIIQNINSNDTSESLYFYNVDISSKFTWRTSRADFPGLAAMYISAFPENRVSGKKIYFVEKDQELVYNLRKMKKLRISNLLVTEHEAGDVKINEIKF